MEILIINSGSSSLKYQLIDSKTGESKAKGIVDRQVDVYDGFHLENPSTLEAWVVRVSDSIAYLNHDLDDAIGAGLLKPEDIPCFSGCHSKKSRQLF